MLLQIIWEQKSTSGYVINHTVEERGYRHWIDIGSTSIYIGLKKLEDKGLIESSYDLKKIGRGALPKKIKITDKGARVLRQEIFLSLSNEPGRQIEVGLAGIPVLNKEHLMNALKKGRSAIMKMLSDIQIKKSHALTLPIKALIEHSNMRLAGDLDFFKFLMHEVKKAG
ncbi:MAG: PadR family transcriptional regulator [bacterium]